MSSVNRMHRSLSPRFTDARGGEGRVEEASFDSAADGNAPVINYSKSAKYHILHPPSIPFPFLLIPRGGSRYMGLASFIFLLSYTLFQRRGGIF